jgi:hypothetical protein
MHSVDLCTRLLKAEQEEEVEGILASCGYGLENESAWQPLGGMENNFSTVGNQQTEPTGALVEKIINGIDAILMAECFARGIDPESGEAPKSMAEAVELFFDVHEGRLENLLPKQQTELAELLTVVAVGEKATPSYLIVDYGEGQTPDAFPDTLLSLNKSNKLRIPFVQGKFNSGGTGVLQFCGERNMQLIISRRHPKAPVRAGDNSREEWGFTLVRRMRPTAGRKNSTYVYLAPGGKVLRFKADGVPALPERRNSIMPRPYMENISYGTCIKLYNFRWKARSIATTEARYELERYLHSPCLPFRLTESRDYKANYYSTTISGVWTSVASSAENPDRAKVEAGFPAFGELNLRGIGKLPYRIVVFKEEVEPKRIPRGVFFTINGQVHGGLPPDFVSRHLKFDYLRDHLLVSVDCTQMESSVREDFFMASRDRVRRNEVYDTIIDSLKDDLRDHEGLRELNAQRRKKQIERAVSDDKETANVFSELLKSDPTLSALFSNGDRLVTSTGPGPNVPFVGRRFPTYFRLAKEPKQGLVKHCPVDRTCRVVFETDAANDYFERADSRGQIASAPSTIEHSHLWNGEFTAKFAVPWNLEPGQQTNVTVRVEDVETESRGQAFESAFTIVADPPLGPAIGEPQPGTARRTTKPRQKGRSTSPRLAIPEVVDEHVPEKPYSSLRISHNDNGGYDFFLNVDNAFLLTELTRAKEEDRSLVKFWFKYGLALCALGMIQEGKRQSEPQEKAEENEVGNAGANGGEDLLRISSFCNGVARVIVPVIRALYRGPQPAA